MKQFKQNIMSTIFILMMYKKFIRQVKINSLTTQCPMIVSELLKQWSLWLRAMQIRNKNIWYTGEKIWVQLFIMMMYWFKNIISVESKINSLLLFFPWLLQFFFKEWRSSLETIERWNRHKWNNRNKYFE